MVENIVQVFRYAVDYCATESDEYNRKLIHGVVGISVSVISALSSVALIVRLGEIIKYSESWFAINDTDICMWISVFFDRFYGESIERQLTALVF